MIISDYQRQYKKDLYDTDSDMKEEQFFILMNGLLFDESAFLQKMHGKYKEIIEAYNNRPEPIELDSPQELASLFGIRRRKT